MKREIIVNHISQKARLKEFLENSLKLAERVEPLDLAHASTLNQLRGYLQGGIDACEWFFED